MRFFLSCCALAGAVVLCAFTTSARADANYVSIDDKTNAYGYTINKSTVNGQIVIEIYLPRLRPRAFATPI